MTDRAQPIQGTTRLSSGKQPVPQPKSRDARRQGGMIKGPGGGSTVKGPMPHTSTVPNRADGLGPAPNYYMGVARQVP